MGEEVPATTAVAKPGQQVIYACARHVMATIRQLGSKNLDITPADPSIHGCKGCLDDWPA